MFAKSAPIDRERLRVRYYYHNLTAAGVGAEHGVTDAELDAIAPRARQAHEAVSAQRAGGMLEWFDLPYQRETAAEIVRAAAEIRTRFDTFVVLGIGGSALGNIALHHALTHPFYNQLPNKQRSGPRVYVLDNIDPTHLAGFLDIVDLRRTVFNVITKSGSTAETMAQLQLFAAELQRTLGSSYRDHLIATTDPTSGDLRRLAEREGIRTFAIPPGVGGRFSVLSPVGLLSAAVAGIDVNELLDGAVAADEHCRSADMYQNAALMNATLQYLLCERGKVMSVMMPYSQQLRDIADWFRQLWAESLGKTRIENGVVTHVGPTPIKALGVTDQHSQIQLYVEGPNNKVINFVVVERFPRELTIPATYPDLPSAGYLGGHTFGELMHAEQTGTELALVAAQRPNCRHILPELRPYTVGQLIMLLEIQTAYSGELYQINAYDQPGVEAGKIATYALMGRPGYERQREAILRQLGIHPEHLI